MRNQFHLRRSNSAGEQVCTRPYSRGFTLVELLVVIGIIALLISILLPALSKARRAATTVQCASNMRQISAAMLSYFSDNKGKLFPETVYYGESTIYPNGWFWATELVGQHYLNAPWAKYPAGWTVSSAAAPTNVPTTGNVFWCPQCNDDADLLGVPAGLVGAPANAYPTHPLNNACAQISNGTNIDANFGAVGIATWYMPFARISSVESGQYPTVGTVNDDPPFVWYEDPTVDAELRNQTGNWTRNLSMVKHSAQMVLLLEGNSAEICYQDGSGSLIYSWAPRLAGRHGSQTSNTRAGHASPGPPTRNTDASTNIAFFDGHVALLPTAPISQSTNSSGLPFTTGGGATTIFYLSNQ
jgi:prepilin-type N-terminal cleavage/methylation domain-containing protein/prepilin-type processing-associated H-X9-DG protein